MSARPVPEQDDIFSAPLKAKGFKGYFDAVDEEEFKEEVQKPKAGLVQWSSSDGKHFFGASHTARVLPPGLYDIESDPQGGIYFSKVLLKTEHLLRFPDTLQDRIVGEITKFWDRKDIFERHGLIHKRGILLYGPPGAGKSSATQLILEDVVCRGGVAVRFAHPSIFIIGMRILREVQPDTPVVVLMEDIDSTIEQYNESTVLNILDGVELVNRTCFIASTNYPEKLGPRIINRPSRFDKRFKIGYPSAESREIYFRHLAGEDIDKLDIPKWVEDTHDLSFAHLRELFIAVVILEDPYEEALATLRGMSELVTSDKDYQNPKKKQGFLAQGSRNGG